MNLDDWLQSAALRLTRAGIDTPRLDAQVLAAFAIGKSRSWVLAHGDEEINPVDLEPTLARRERREPLAYITGVREFYGREFKVGPGCLIPRQETEALVELALELAEPRDRILDVGTGSGCIAITLALEEHTLETWACDRSPESLEWAFLNSVKLGADVRFVLSDLANGFARGTFDIVVSNPPYIATTAVLEPELAEHEPHAALFATGDGLDVYRRLANEATRVTKRAIVLEVGDDMADDVNGVFLDAGWSALTAKKDGLGHWRALAFRPPGLA